MKRIISIAAAVAAMFSLTSCEDFVNAMLNNYVVGSNTVFIGNAEVTRIESSSASGYIFNFYEKEEYTEDYSASCSLIINDEDYKKALEGKTSVEGVAFGGYSADGKVQIGYLSSKIATNSGLDKVYDTKPVSFDGTIRIIEGSEGSISITLRATLTLKVSGSEETDEFPMWLTYNGTPENKGTTTLPEV